MSKLTYPTFLDIEASGLIADSYPIEIAWNNAEGKLTSFLIKPHSSWTYWSDEAQELHRIYREELDEYGISIKEACDLLDSTFSGSHIYSDAPSFEAQWLDKLYDTAKRKRPFTIKGISKIPSIRKSFERIGQSSSYELFKKQAFVELSDQHRAEVDVQALMKVYEKCEEL